MLRRECRMELAGVAAAFGVIMFLDFQKCFGGSCPFNRRRYYRPLSKLSLMGSSWRWLLECSALSPLSLAIAVALISGLGRLMRESGDLETMVSLWSPSFAILRC